MGTVLLVTFLNAYITEKKKYFYFDSNFIHIHF